MTHLAIPWSVSEEVVKANDLKKHLGSRLNDVRGEFGVVLSDDIKAVAQWPQGRLRIKHETRNYRYRYAFSGMVSNNTSMLSFAPWDATMVTAFCEVDWSEGVLLRGKWGGVQNNQYAILAAIRNMDDDDNFILSKMGGKSIDTYRFFTANRRVIACAKATNDGPFVSIPLSKKLKLAVVPTDAPVFIDCVQQDEDTSRMGASAVHSIDTTWQGFDPDTIIQAVEKYVYDCTIADKVMAEIRCIFELKGLKDAYIVWEPLMVLGSSTVKSPYPYVLGSAEVSEKRFGCVKKMRKFALSL